MPDMRLAELVDLLPAEASYRRRFQPDDWMEAEVGLLAEARTDPSFGNMFVDAFVEVRQPLPASLHESEFLRAYAYRRFGVPDPAVESAFALEHDPNPRRRILVRCLLLRPEYAYDTVGRRTGLSGQAMRIYQALFWPVRDRHGMFITSLVFPRSRQGEFEPGYAQAETEENLAYRTAVHHGIEPVEVLLGIKNDIMKKPLDDLADTLMRKILQNALFIADMDCLNQDLPGLKNALAVVRLLNPGRRQRQVDLSTLEVKGVSAAVAVSQSLGRTAAAQKGWPAGATDAGEKASDGQRAKKAAPAGEQLNRPPRAKSKRTATPFGCRPKAQPDQLDAAA